MSGAAEVKPGSESDPLAVAINLMKEELAAYKRPKKVLFVEDDQFMRELFGRRAAEFNCVVEYATDGESGMEMALKGNFDLLILDVVLPNSKYDGVDIFRAVREKLGDDPPVTIFTGMLTNELALRIESIGFASFIKKPNAFTDRFITSFFATFGIRRKMQS